MISLSIIIVILFFIGFSLNLLRSDAERDVTALQERLEEMTEERDNALSKIKELTTDNDALRKALTESEAYIEKFVTPQIETEHLKAEAKLKKKRKGKR